MKKANSFLSPDSKNLKNLLTKAAIINELESNIKQFLPKECRPHINVCNIKQGKLILTTDNAAWQTKIRFQSGEILSSLRQAGYHQLSGLKITVKPKDSTRMSETVAPKRKHFSSKAKQSIKRILNQLGKPDNGTSAP